jgi:integrase
MPGIYRWLRWPLLLLAATGLVFLAAWRLTRPDVLQWDDTVEYWAAGRLNARGQNPYAPEALHRLERQAGRPLEEPLMMWNPPLAAGPGDAAGPAALPRGPGFSGSCSIWLWSSSPAF